MFDKIELNNELICMKKTIQKAKVFVGQKLIKKLKQLKTNLEKEPKSLKIIGRSEKLNNLLKQLKQSNNFQLASHVLTYQSDPQRVLTNITSSIDNLLLAHLCTQKLIQTEIQRIKDKYNLESIPNWQETIREIGKKKKRRKEVAERKQKNLERKTGEKERRQLKRKREEWLVENIDPKDLPSSSEKTSSVVPTKTTKIKEKKAPTTKPQQQKPKIIDELHVKPIIVAKKSVDSFFITDSGTNYMSTAVVERTQAPNPNDGLDRRERRAQQFAKSSRIKPKVHLRQALHNTKSIDRQPHHRQTKINGKPMETNDLHPSWAAKQKTKGISQFQGKKMKFDDSATILSDKPAAALTSAEDKLHPSWAAKQKQKPIISEFTGKKITFSDD